MQRPLFKSTADRAPLAVLIAATAFLAACGPGKPPPPQAAPPAAAPEEEPSTRPPTTPAQEPPAVMPPGEPTATNDSPPVPAIATDSPPAGLAEPATAPVAPAPAVVTADRPPLELLGRQIPAGTSTRLMWSASKIFEGMSSETPVLVVNGREAGPVLCITAAIHGDELNGIEMVRRVFQDLSPDTLKGAVIGIPIVNIHGFRRGSRYLPDRRDLNRFFPGNPQGSSAARIGHSLFENIVRRCSALVDLHTGSFYRSNLPQVRADLSIAPVAALAHGFGGMLVLHSEAAPGTLRRAATDAGIPAVILEAGEPLRLQPKQVQQGVAGINRLLGSLGMVRKTTLLRQPEPVYYRSRWVRADHGGVLFSVVRLGQTVRAGDILGNVTDPITNEQNLIYAPVDGRIIGMAVNQVVMPGFAAFHLGTESQPGPQAALSETRSDEEAGKDRDVEALERNGAVPGQDTE